MREEDDASLGVRGFSCGSDPWDEEVAEFIRSGDAWRAHRSGKSVTVLYFVDDREESLVGFYNIAKKTVGYPLFKGERKVPCFLITYIAVSTEHQGHRYFSRMLEDIARAATEARQEALYLFVDERNTAAISRYERKGFASFPDADPYVDPESGASYRRMILPLNRSSRKL